MGGDSPSIISRKGISKKAFSAVAGVLVEAPDLPGVHCAPRNAA